MSPARGKKPPETIIDYPRYKKKPALLLFEIFILDVIGLLSPEKRKGIQKLNVAKIFSTRANHWKPALREVLKLSDTIETAIRDRWYKRLGANGKADPEKFAKSCADSYFKEGSTVDVWTERSLKKAQERIAGFKKKKR